MKKTIAKIMAAAMVFSTVIAPNADAATLSKNVASSYPVSALYFRNATDGTVTEVAPGGEVVENVYFTASQLEKLEDEISGYINGGKTDEISGFKYSDDASDDIELSSFDVTVSSAYDGTSDITTTGFTPSTATTKTAHITNVSDFAWETTTTDKVVTANGGEFKDTITLDDVARRTDRRLATRPVVWNNGRTPGFVWRPNDIALGYIQKLMAGDTVVVSWNFRNAAGFIVPWTWRLQLLGNVATDAYWNGFVKLEGDNDFYTPIRVRYEVIGESVAGANEGIVRVASGIAGNIYTVNGFNQRLKIVNVNSYDLALLKSDYAKGKNLMLNDIYAWVGDKGFNTAYTNWNDTMRLDINEYSEISLGQIDTISARLFKDTKEKLVKAEYAKFIHNGAFRKNKQLKKAIIGTEKSAKKINEKAFYDCKKLTTFKVGGKTLKQVGKNALGGSTDKKSLRIKIKAGSKSKYNEDVKKFKKSGVKKAKFAKI